jgi:hypothetical protein
MFVYNVRENTWYSTPLPTDGRSAAYYAQTWPYPVSSSATGLTPIGQSSGVNYPIYQDEIGTDFVRGSQVNAILSSITSPAMSLVGGGLTLFNNAAASPTDVWTQYAFFEQDMLFGSNLQLSVLGREYPQDQDVVLDQRTITKQTSGNYYDLQVQARYLRWQITSNVGSGFFKFGQPLISYREGDRSR